MSVFHSVFISNNAKLWTNIVYVVATYKILVTPLPEISDGVFFAWMGIVGGVELLKRVIAGKMGVTAEEPKTGPVPAEAATDVESPKKRKR